MPAGEGAAPTFFAAHAAALLAASLAAILALKAFLAWGHLPWMDELQSLQLARAIQSPADVREILRYEGHPPLWHLVLRAALAIWDDWTTLNLVAFACATATTLLILLRSPFPFWWRLALPCSFLLLFEYGVVSRSYSLAVPLMFVVAAWPRSRWAGVALVGLCWLSVPTAVAALLLAAVLRRRREQAMAGLALVAVAALAAVAFSATPADHQSFTFDLNYSFARDAMNTINRWSIVGLPGTVLAFPMVWDLPPPQDVVILAAGLLLLGFYLVSVARLAPEAALALVGYVLFLTALSLGVYVLSVRHFGFIVVLALTLQWLYWRDTVATDRASQLMHGSQAICGLAAAAHLMITPFSPDRDVAAFIEAHRAPGERVVTLRGERGVGYAAHTGQPFHALDLGCDGMFQVWRRIPDRQWRDYLIAMEATVAGLGGRAWLITGTEPPAKHVPPGLILTLQRSFDQAISQQAFVYIAETSRPAPKLTTTPCKIGL